MLFVWYSCVHMLNEIVNVEFLHVKVQLWPIFCFLWKVLQDMIVSYKVFFKNVCLPRQIKWFKILNVFWCCCSNNIVLSLCMPLFLGCLSALDRLEQCFWPWNLWLKSQIIPFIVMALLVYLGFLIVTFFTLLNIL